MNDTIDRVAAKYRRLEKAVRYAVNMTNAFPICPLCHFRKDETPRHSKDCPIYVLSAALDDLAGD